MTHGGLGVDVVPVDFGSRAIDPGRYENRYLVVQQAPRFDAEHGKVQICWQCPDATIRNGQLTPVCIAGRVSPRQSTRRESRSGYLGDAPLELRPDRVLRAGDAFGQVRLSRQLERLAVRAIGGRTRESRWIGSAAVGPTVGRAVWERVCFGGAARGGL